MSRQRLAHSGKKFVALLLLAWLVLPTSLTAQELRFRPGFNLFSHQQDIQLGRDASADVDKQLPLIKDAEVTRYVSDLGRKLAGFAPGDTDYPWTFKVVDSQDINAFALPGGFIYINRGVIEAADNEAQLAGVMAHEIGHVVMRHGTHQATQRVLAQVPLAILGGFLGQGSSLTAQLAQMGIGFGVNSIFLKNSRGAEAQADEVGTYILYHADYDPHAMAQFFGIIQKKYPQRTLAFFSDHPNPENRIRDVDALIPRLGPAREWKNDSAAFQATKKRVLRMPPPPKAKPEAGGAASAPSPPPQPSSRLLAYRADQFSIGYPDNWKVQEDSNGVTLAPPQGIISGPQGEPAQAYGASIFKYVPPGRTNWQLAEATQQLIDSLRQANPQMREVKKTQIRIRGRQALSTLIENDSPLAGQKEIDQLITVPGRGNLIAIIFVAPQSAYQAYQPTFNAMLRSLELR
jgi:Zn-dependent protease with chaperone function